MATRLDANIEIKLIFPYGPSLSKLEDLCSIWNLRVVTSSTNREGAVLGMPWPAFKRMFNSNPIRNKKLAVPRQMASYVSALRVKGVQVVELKRNAKETP